jgi:membrane fusion protein, adhesin transport system
MLFDVLFSDDDARRQKTIARLENYHRRPYSLLLWIIAAGLAAFVLWAWVFNIDQVARSTGEVIASSRVQIIQAVDGGVLAELNVKEGDAVERGQVLAQLDQVKLSASVKEIEARLSSLKVKAIRLRAEVIGVDKLQFPDELQQYPDLVKVEQALFQQRRFGLKEEIRTIENAIRLAQEESGLVRQLVKSGDANRSEVIRSENALNEANSKLIIRKNRFFEEASTELTKVEDGIAQNEQVLAQRQQQLDDSTFTALVPGIVKNIRVTTVGGVLRAGEELMQIIPIDDQLIIEAKVSPVDIAQIRPGLAATIRFDPFDYTIFGGVEGKVVYVSADTLKEDTPKGEEIYYRVHVSSNSLPVTTTTGKEIEILPGMTAQVDIRTGSRTVMDYLLKPLRKTVSESFGER